MAAEDFVRPGHISSCVSKRGVLVRSGHTEAGTDLALAGHRQLLLAELVNDDGTVQRLPELFEFAKEHQLKIISIADLIAIDRLENN